MKNLILIGGGGFSWEILEVAEQNNYVVEGFLDDTVDNHLPIPCLGGLKEMDSLSAERVSFFCAIGATDFRGIEFRRQFFLRVKRLGLKMPSLVSKYARVARAVELGCGSFVGDMAVVSVGAKVGQQTILNTGAVVGHHAIIGDRSILAPQSFVGGSSVIESDCLLGVGSNVLQNIKVGSSSIVGSGTTVFRNLKPGSTVLPVNPKVISNS